MNSPPKLSKEDIDLIISTRPVCVNHPDYMHNVHLADYIGSIKSELSIAHLELFEKRGYSNWSWRWNYREPWAQDVPLDEYGPLSLPKNSP